MKSCRPHLPYIADMSMSCVSAGFAAAREKFLARFLKISYLAFSMMRMMSSR